MSRSMSFETALIHAGEPEERIGRAVVLPIFQSSTYLYGGESRYEDLRYIRLNNTPNHQVLHSKLAVLEKGEAALVTASGMAAISTSLLTILSSGDHLLAQNCLYGGTHDLIVEELPRLGIECDLVEGGNPQDWENKIKPNTRALYLETISNPLMQVVDLKAAVEFAHAHGLLALIDNTFATPLNFQPLELGFDLVLHSGTKYLNGHTDIVAGVVVGSGLLVKQINRKLLHLGGALDPHACFLLHRGLKTLALRVRQQNHSALALARFLEGQESVLKVNYPGLESSPSHQQASRFLTGYGGMLSFELKGGMEQCRAFLEGLQLAVEAPSLGGVETLVTRPATTSHAGLGPHDREAAGIADSLIRVSVGIEGTEDLIEDFARALAQVDQIKPVPSLR